MAILWRKFGVAGHGQEIGILIDTFPLDADLTQFWQINDINNSIANVDRLNVDNATVPPVEGEESLDAEWTSGTAPGARIRICASGSLDFPSLDSAIDNIIADVALRPGPRQVSVSLGLGELYLHASASACPLGTVRESEVRKTVKGIRPARSAYSGANCHFSKRHHELRPIRAVVALASHRLRAGRKLLAGPDIDLGGQIGVWIEIPGPGSHRAEMRPF
jgi:hypothetical protein